MTKEEAILKMAQDMVDNMNLDDMAIFVRESLEYDMSEHWTNEDLIEEWDNRDLAINITDKNPFKD